MDWAFDKNVFCSSKLQLTYQKRKFCKSHGFQTVKTACSKILQYRYIVRISFPLNNLILIKKGCELGWNHSAKRSSHTSLWCFMAKLIPRIQFPLFSSLLALFCWPSSFRVYALSLESKHATLHQAKRRYKQMAVLHCLVESYGRANFVSKFDSHRVKHATIPVGFLVVAKFSVLIVPLYAV